jgi:hypothetical protein
VSLMEHKLLTLTEHMSSSSFFSAFRATRSLALYVCLVDRCLSFCTVSIGYCVCSSSICGFWLPFGVSKPSLRPVRHKSLLFFNKVEERSADTFYVRFVSLPRCKLVVLIYGWALFWIISTSWQSKSSI